MLRAVASVCLCFFFLLAPTLQSAPKPPCSQDAVKKVEFLISKAPNLKGINCRLYTPTVEDFQQNCPISSLKCFASEVKVLIEEWVAVRGIRTFRLYKDLEILAPLFNQTGSECRQCELLKEEGAEKFLEGLRLILMMMNSKYCQGAPPFPRRVSKRTS